MINSNTKGKRGEREFANFLKNYGFEARRGQQYAGGGDSPDVVTNMEGLHWEVKRVETFQLYKALEQARFDATFEHIPVVAHRRNKKPWVAVISMDDFLEMYRVLKKHKLIGEVLYGSK